ncbi:response regulator [Flavobacteriaceae bacterium GF1]
MGAKKLFLVDDDVIFKIAAEVLIKTHKLADEVVQMSNGLEAYNALIALEHSPNDLPDVMLLDINMPVMNGWELLEELKQGPEIIRNQVQIHILTSSIAPEDLNLSKTYDFIDGYITKPLTNSDIDKVKKGL